MKFKKLNLKIINLILSNLKNEQQPFLRIIELLI